MNPIEKAWAFLKQEEEDYSQSAYAEGMPTWPGDLLHVLESDDEPVIIEPEEGDDPRSHPIMFDPKEGGYHACSNCGNKPTKCSCPCRQCGGYSTPDNAFNHPNSLEFAREMGGDDQQGDPTATACQCPEHGGGE